MPFGLHGAHVTFQSRMDKVLEPCEAFARTYMNDIVIFSDSWEEHLVHDKRTLDSIEDARLRIHPRNIKLAQNEFRYLGKCTGIEEIAPLEIKVRTVQYFPLPLSKKEIHSFIGIATYYQRFINNFAEIDEQQSLHF